MKTRKLKIQIFRTINSRMALTYEDGNEIFKKLDTGIYWKFNIILNFKNIQTTSTTFLNASFGQLYLKHSEEQIKKHLSFVNCKPEIKTLIEPVILKAKEYRNNFDLLDEFLSARP